MHKPAVSIFLGFAGAGNVKESHVMPAQEGRLTEAKIKVVASYVWGLSNKPQPKAAP